MRIATGHGTVRLDGGTCAGHFVQFVSFHVLVVCESSPTVLVSSLGRLAGRRIGLPCPAM